MMTHDRKDLEWAGIVAGMLIVALGLVLLVDQAGLFGSRPSWRVWPLVIVAAGLARFSQPRSDGSRDGGWLLLIGVWLILNEMRILRFRDSWPLILVALGVAKI